ncbi:hypothetical protein [Thiolapillus sp.]
MNNKSALLGAFPLIWGSLVLSQSAVAATAVTVNNQPCGNLTSLETTPEQVTLSVDGDCGSGNAADTPANVVNRTIAAVTEGTTGSVDVMPGVIVQLPYSIAIASQPTLSGASASVSGTTVVYQAPPVGTVAADGTADSFTYTISDSSAAPNAVTATVNVTVNKGDVNTNGACVSTPTLLCKTPDLDISQTGGQIKPIERDAGVTHVWTIPPGKRVSTYYGATIGIRYVTASSLPVTISLSDNYAVDASGSLCTVVVDREEGALIGYSEQDPYTCLLDPAKTYYFRVSSPEAGTYWLVW